MTNLKRKLCLSMHFGQSMIYDSNIPINTTKTQWNPPPASHDTHINNYIEQSKITLHSIIDNTRLIYNKSDKLLHDTLTQLYKNKSITIKPSDKNLGLVVLDTDHYTNMCLKHLNDPLTYNKVTDYNPNKIYAMLRIVLKKHKRLYRYQTANSSTLTPLAKSLLQLQNHPTLRIAPFYCLPKIHKSLINPIPGRPIVSSNSTITYHVSVFLDNIFHPIIRRLDTVCTSANQIIIDMSNFTTTSNSVILCADVTALYPNIPINEGIIMVKKILTEIPYYAEKENNFYIDLLHWVLHNNYCTYQNNTYLQLKGTAMGTPTATSYANIFLYGVEKPIIRKYKPTYYKRYIDDIYAIFDNPQLANNFISDFNQVLPSIKLEATTVERSGIMLDLSIKLLPKETNGNITNDIVTTCLYQKPANKYQYIPTISEHAPHIFNSFVLQEICRIRLACANNHDFTIMNTLFANRLRARGYSDSIHRNAMKKIPTRTSIMQKIQSRRDTAPDTTDTPDKIISTFQIPRRSQKIPLKTILALPPYLTNHPKFKKAFPDPRLIVGTRNPPSLGSYILRSLDNSQSSEA